MSSTSPVPESPRPRGQRRFVTVLFSDVSGSSEHAERLDAEEYADLLMRFRTLAREIVPRHGGTIARLQGDGLLALFGHLHTREDDGVHAAEAALELHEAVGALQVGTGVDAVPMALHSGIHAGLVLLIEGDIELGRFDVVGEVPNSAARLCSAAARGEIFISAASLGPMAHFLDTVPLGHLPIRGRSESLEVLRVAGRGKVARRIDASARRGVVDLIGREPAIRELASAAERARAGAPTTVVVQGEPGVGKTRLVDDFLQGMQQGGWQVLRGYCVQGLSAEPLQPFLQMLRDEPQRPDIKRAGAAIAQRAAQGPLVLSIDDWQWADDASRALLHRLRDTLPATLVLLARRPSADDELPLEDARLVDLQPLGEADAQHLIRAWLHDANPFVTQDIWRRSGGSPLFIEELCRAVGTSLGLRVAPRNMGVAWIDGLVASRLEALPPAQADCVRVASVIGHNLERSLLEGLVGPARAADLAAVIDSGAFLVPGSLPGTLRFRHLITRDAVYATVPLDDRVALHVRVADSLLAQGEVAATEHLEALAYHCSSARQPSRAADFAEAAGDKALSAMALDRARAQYSAALRALDTIDDPSPAVRARWCAIAQRLGQTCVFDALDVDPMLPLFHRAARLATELDDADAIARAHYWLGYVYYGKGQPKLSVRHCQEAMRHAQASGDVRLAAQVHATLGQALASAGRYDEALPALREAVESKRQNARRGSGTAIGSAYSLARTGYTLADIGRFDDAHACFDEAMHLLGDVQHAVCASVIELRSAVYLWQGRWAEAEAAGLAGADLALKCRSRFNTEMGRALAACGTWARTRDPAALDTLRASTRWIEARGGAVSTSLNYGWLVEATLELGLREEAIGHAARLMMRLRAQDVQGAGQGLRAMAVEAAGRGQVDRAVRWLARAQRLGLARGSQREAALDLLARARVGITLSDRTEWRRSAEEALRAFERLEMSAHAARAASLLSTATT